jgi:hypothetical protein
MTPAVSNHAVERYAERVLGEKFAELRPELIEAIRADIGQAARSPIEVSSYRKKTSECVFVVENGIVATILPPYWNTENRNAALERASRRQRRRAEENHTRPRSRRRVE